LPHLPAEHPPVHLIPQLISLKQKRCSATGTPFLLRSSFRNSLFGAAFNLGLH
jgi:hypothetical protein